MRDILRMVLTLVAISGISAVGLAWIEDLTDERIAEEIRQDTLEAIDAVLPEYNNAPDLEAVTIADVLYYPGVKDGEVVGLALPVHSEAGYSGDIDALVGLSPAGEVTGVRILSHAETPGLGAKFTDDEYLAQFVGKTLQTARWLVKKDGGDFDQITGATITPRALLQAMEAGMIAFGADREQVLAAVARSGASGDARPADSGEAKP